jgi:hypothetical protein
VTRPPCDLPHMRYISFSYSDEITAHNNNKMVRLIQSPGYKQLWGDRFIMVKTGERRISRPGHYNPDPSEGPWARWSIPRMAVQ